MKKMSLFISDIMESGPVAVHHLSALGVYPAYRRLPNESMSHVGLRIGKKSSSVAMVRGQHKPRARALRSNEVA